jgi:putative transposase
VKTKQPTAVVIEDLNVSSMMKNRKLSRAISDAGFRMMRGQLEYKCKWYGSQLIIADRFYPSSKTCSRCAVIKPELKLSERVFVCEACGFECDRDLNAALNLEKYYTASSVGSACGEDVRPELAQADFVEAGREHQVEVINFV